MPIDLTQRPGTDEYASFYQSYIGGVPDGDIRATLETQTGDALSLLSTIPESRGSFRYAPGKWSVKENILHVIDSERIFSMRLLCVARGETKALPGFEQDDYVRTSDAEHRPLLTLINEFTAVRSSTMQLMRNLPDAGWILKGNANGLPVTARALAWIIAGHERHHLRVLRERYL